MNRKIFKLINSIFTATAIVIVLTLIVAGWLGGLVYFMKVMGLMDW